MFFFFFKLKELFFCAPMSPVCPMVSRTLSSPFCVQELTTAVRQSVQDVIVARVPASLKLDHSNKLFAGK